MGLVIETSQYYISKFGAAITQDSPFVLPAGVIDPLDPSATTKQQPSSQCRNMGHPLPTNPPMSAKFAFNRSSASQYTFS